MKYLISRTSGHILIVLFILCILTTCRGGQSSSPEVTFVQLNLNDTGIAANQCYQAGSYILVDCGSAGAISLSGAQDGIVGRDANVVTNSNADGKLGFSFASVTGGCVKDNVTGLMWEIKTTDGGLRDWNKTYTNYTPSFDPYSLYGTAGDASGYVNAVNATNLCGYSDWRLPTAEELQSIVDYGVANPAIDATWFPNTPGSEYWTSSPIGSQDAMIVNFCCGDIYPSQGVDACVYPSCYVGGRAQPYSVRLVRGGQLMKVEPYEPRQIPKRFIASVDGQEVTDSQTKLIWRRCAEGAVLIGDTYCTQASTFTNEEALQRAAAQANSTGKAWRLPNVKELYSLIPPRASQPSTIILPFFPDISSTNWVWSATPNVGYNSTWAVLFPNIGWTYSMTHVPDAVNPSRYCVWLVRDGQ